MTLRSLVRRTAGPSCFKGGRVMAASGTQHGSAGTDEILTAKGIEERYPSEWVLIEDLAVDEPFDVNRGKVVWLSSDRDEVYQKAIDLGANSAATLFTGP